MTEQEKLSKVKLLLGNECCLSDSALTVYLEIACDKIINRLYPFGREDGFTLPEKYDKIHVEIAVYLASRSGAEGEVAHGENGVSRTYASADVPSEMFRGIIPYVKM